MIPYEVPDILLSDNGLLSIGNFSFCHAASLVLKNNDECVGSIDKWTSGTVQPEASIWTPTVRRWQPTKLDDGYRTVDLRLKL